jgi:hypothetical protein
MSKIKYSYLQNHFIVINDDNQYLPSTIMNQIDYIVKRFKAICYFIVTNRPKLFWFAQKQTFEKSWSKTIHPLHFKFGIQEPEESLICCYDARVINMWSRSISSKLTIFRQLTSKNCIMLSKTNYNFDCYMCIIITMCITSKFVCHFEFGKSFSQETGFNDCTDGVITIIPSKDWIKKQYFQTSIYSSNMNTLYCNVGKKSGCKLGAISSSFVLHLWRFKMPIFFIKNIILFFIIF